MALENNENSKGPDQSATTVLPISRVSWGSSAKTRSQEAELGDEANTMLPMGFLPAELDLTMAPDGGQQSHSRELKVRLGALRPPRWGESGARGDSAF